VAPTGDFADLVAPISAAYRHRDLQPLIRLSPLAGSDPDKILATAGWALIGETLVMSAPIGEAVADPDCSIEAAPTEAWLGGFADARGIPPDRRAVHDRIIDRILPDRAFATAEMEGRPVAWGLAVAERGWVGIFDIVTLPAARRRGVARRMVTSLLAWGRDKGAGQAYLQVVAENEAGIALYRDLGFTEVYRYHYRLGI